MKDDVYSQVSMCCLWINSRLTTRIMTILLLASTRGTISGKVNTPDAHHIIGELCNVLDVKKHSADSISASCNIVNDIEKNE